MEAEVVEEKSVNGKEYDNQVTNIVPKENKMSLIYRLFCWCSGARLYLLKQCPTDYNKYFGIGAVVIMTGVMAFLSGFYAILTIFDNLYVAAGFGVAWAFMIFFLDWYLVASLKKQNSFRREFTISIPRFLLSIFIAVVISKPLELKLFEKEIQQEISLVKMSQSINYQELLGKEFEEINKLKEVNREFENEIKDKEKERDRLFELFIAEAEGRSSTGIQGKGPVYREKKQQFDNVDKEFKELKKRNQEYIDRNLHLITELNKQKQLKLSKANKSTETYDGFLARLEAINSLSQKSQSIAITNWFVVLLFILIESSPIIVKLMSKRGPYDELLDAEEELKRIEALKKVNFHKMRYNDNIEVRKEVNDLRKAMGTEVQKEYLEDLTKTQRELNQIKIENWRKKELEKVDVEDDVYENIDGLIAKDFSLPVEE